MAVMWPRTLPPDVTANTLRSTECAVFERLRVSLDGSFVVFYSRPWLGLAPDGEEIDGECDFVVAHARLGLLTLEVKGGAVAYDPRNDRWTSRDRWNVTHNIKNPVEQARSAKHQILRKLRASPHWQRRRIRARHGVVLPHSAAPHGDLGADMPKRIFCFVEDFRDGLRDWILERLGDTPRQEESTTELGPDGVRALEQILAKPFQLRTPLGTLLTQDDDALQVLTQQQFHILRYIEDVPRAAISGAAGTGKTVLAMEEAKRCANQGARTSFICYNRGLATCVRHHLREVPLTSAMTFHELCAEFAAPAALAPPYGIPERQLFDDVWPELLMQAYERLDESPYDAIIVDEGQDFLPHWWTALLAGLNPDGPGLLRVFFDDNQRVYASANVLRAEVELTSIRLSFNLRNTKRIHEVVRQHYTGHNIEALGPEGVDVRWITINSPGQLAKRVSHCVARFCSLEHLSPGDIAVLVASRSDIEAIAPNNRLGRFRAVRCDEPSKGRLIVDSIRRFKGLQRPVIVIAATPETVIDTELPYVALSRARTQLVIVGIDGVLSRIRDGTVQQTNRIGVP